MLDTIGSNVLLFIGFQGRGKRTNSKRYVSLCCYSPWSCAIAVSASALTLVLMLSVIGMACMWRFNLSCGPFTYDRLVELGANSRVLCVCVCVCVCV